MEIPEPLIARFRSLSLERVGRVEAVWNSLLEGADDEEAPRTLARELHTLKGDARVVGYEEVHTLSHKLEELVALASTLEYHVSEDFELVVSMATQFLGILLRKKDTMGIDLDGFLRQIDEVIRETQVLRRSRPTNPRIPLPVETNRLSEGTRQRLAGVATDAFLEYLSARNATSRARLRRVWQTLREELSQIESVAIAPLLDRHVASTVELASELDKLVDVRIDVEDLRLDARVAEAVDQAILHLLRNAIDHGIEPPSTRAACGKSDRGTVRVSVGQSHGSLVEIIVTDDGHGIDLECVRAKGTQRDLLDRMRTPNERELVDLVFLPGFTTREMVGDISGRGVGLDAVKSAIIKVGGHVRLQTRFGAGVQVTLAVPAPVRQLRVYQFLAPGGTINFAVSARWTPTIVDDAHDAIDPVQAIQLLGGSRQTMTGWPAHAIRDRVLRLRWGFLELALRTATEPQLVTAERICPTSDECPLEVVLIDGVEALLVRPEHVKDLLKPPAQ